MADTKTLKNTLKPYLRLPGMAYPDPRYVDDLQWRLRYASQSITRNDQLVLASVASAYVELLCMTQRHRNRRTSQIKAAMNAVPAATSAKPEATAPRSREGAAPTPGTSRARKR